MKTSALQLYRLAVVAVIAWLIRDLAVRQRTQGDSPIVVDEVKGFFADIDLVFPPESPSVPAWFFSAKSLTAP